MVMGQLSNAASCNPPFGWVAEEAVDLAYEQVANLMTLRERFHTGDYENSGRRVSERTFDDASARRSEFDFFVFMEGRSFLMELDKEIALPSGSACSSATFEPS